MRSPRPTVRPGASLLALVGLLACQGSPPPPGPAAAFVPDATMPRAAIPDQFKWPLAPLFADDQAFAAALDQAAAARARLAPLSERLDDGARLHDCLALYFDTRLLTNKLTLYASLRLDSAQSDTAAQAMHEQSLQALNELMRLSSRIRQGVLALEDRTLAAAYAREPRLRAFTPYLDEQRRRRARVLGPEAENILGLFGDNLWAEIDLNEIPSDFEKAFQATMAELSLGKLRDEQHRLVSVTLSSYPQYRASTDRRIRRQAVEKLLGALRSQEKQLAATFAGQVRFNVTLARARGYDTALAAYLDKENVEPVVYHNLVDTVARNVAPLHAYVRLRREILGLDRVHLYDLYTPLVPAVDFDFPYETARQLLPEALAPLGPEYVTVLAGGLDPRAGWLDLYPHQDKRSGAFCASVYGLHPFVKMNYYAGFDDLSTLAHEYGHALHSHLAYANQPYVTSSYPPFLAEIASTLNEKLLVDHLLANAKTDDERLFLLTHLLETIRTTIYRQTLFADFELRAHRAAEAGTPLTAELLNQTYRQLIGEYYGPDFTVGPDDEVEWAYVPHFYYKYYIYSYATGLSAGIALAERVKSGDPAKRDAYLSLLKGGSSKPPLVILEQAGVDLRQPAAIEAATALFARTVDEIETLWRRRNPR